MLVKTKLLLSQTHFYHDKYLLWQKFCCDEHTFVMTKDMFCHDKNMFVMTNTFVMTELLLPQKYLWQLLPLIVITMSVCTCVSVHMLGFVQKITAQPFVKAVMHFQSCGHMTIWSSMSPKDVMQHTMAHVCVLTEWLPGKCCHCMSDTSDEETTAFVALLYYSVGAWQKKWKL